MSGTGIVDLDRGKCRCQSRDGQKCSDGELHFA